MFFVKSVTNLKKMLVIKLLYGYDFSIFKENEVNTLNAQDEPENIASKEPRLSGTNDGLNCSKDLSHA
ncbi:hypothetical protein CTN07_02265 [Photobacterium damselae]|nr:hypothetical protein CTN07_02265 [Photobacterium damselae]